jgi:hypothetical protein
MPDDDAPARPTPATHGRRRPVLGGAINDYRAAA